jgi:succinylglutamate desuccinylase
MFRAQRGDLASAAEAARADAIMRATAVFFSAADTDKWHLDLHTAIRPSHYPTFAVVPDVIAEPRKQTLLHWLGRAGIGAAILSSKSAGTYSAWTAEQFAAASATVELGQVGAIGGNDLSRFDAARAALDDFLRTGAASPGGDLPQIFLFAQELVKLSDAFRMAFDRDTKNFTAMQPGEIIAEDGDTVYRVGARTEYVVFPNPDVRVGLRAGLMVVPVGTS